MGGITDIARHFGLKAVYVLVAWGVTRVVDAGRKHFLQQRSRRLSEAGTAPAQPEAPRPAAKPPTARVKIYHNPTTEFKPSNPPWLRDAASLDPAELATDLSWQCPQLIKFQAQVASRQSPWGGPQPQPSQPPASPSRIPRRPLPAAQQPQQQQPQLPLIRAASEGGAAATGGSAAGGVAGAPPSASATPAAPQQLIAFGRQARKQLFALEPGVTYLNHGSYGAAFRLALEVQSWYQQQLEAQPVAFMETVALKGLVAAVADVARFVGAPPADCVPLPNATSAINAVLACVPLRRGDWILMLNTTYPAIKSSIARVAAASGASIIEVQLGMEELLRPACVVGAVQAAMGVLGGRRRIRLAVLDHVVSFPPVVLPVAELAELLKKQVGARVLVDGAHAVGNLPGLQVPALGADYYTTNLHKWGCSPKGAALLWAAPERQQELHPLVTSHGYRLGFRGEFLWQGTADPSAWLAVPAALAVLRALGPERVAAHNAHLVSEAATLLRRRWGASLRARDGDGDSAGRQGRVAQRTRAGTGPRAEDMSTGGSGEGDLAVLGGGGVGMDWERGGAAGMLAVQLPVLREYGCTAEDAARLHKWLRSEKSIEVPVVAALERLWVRISAQIYNELADYEQLATVVDSLRR